MLKNRVITALILAPLTVAAILLLSPDGFALIWGAIILACAYEWSDLAGLAGPLQRFGFVAAILAMLVAARVFAMDWAPGELPPWFYWPVVTWWLLWALAFRRMPTKLLSLPYPTGVRLLAGAIILVSGWVFLVWLRLNFLQWQVLYFVVLISLADVAAFFVGKRFGKTKLIEAISPGKTVEGVYGALLVAALLALGVGLYVGLDTLAVIDFIFLSLLTVAFSAAGDLFESLAKRIRGVKDSGGILPGHGGVLDRVDSLLAGISIFYVGSLLIPIFLFTGADDTPIILAPDSPPAMEAPHHDPEEGEAGEPEQLPEAGEDSHP